MQFTVACAQIAPEKGKVSQNLDKIGDCIRRAAGEGADLVVFPETSTSGYFLEGGVLECALTAEEICHELQERLSNLDRRIDVVVGFYLSQDGNLYNACAYLEVDGGRARVLKIYRKFFLPTYGLFDEERFVSRGTDLGVVDTRFGKVAMIICEDAWHSILPTLCAMRGAQMLLVPAASPGRGFKGEQIENHDRYERLMKAIAEEHGVFCVNPQLCGFEGGKGFVGGSMVFDPFGTMISKGPSNEEYMLMAPVDLTLVEVARAKTPLLSDLRSAWGDIQRIVNEN